MDRRCILDVWVAGKPRPKGSLQTFVPTYGDQNPDPSLRGQPVRREDGSIVVNVVEDNAATKGWMKAVREAAAAAMTAQPSEGVALDIEIEAFLPRPEGHYGSGANATFVKAVAPAYPIAERTGDVDKLARAILDAIGGTVMVTDAAVRSLGITKDYAVPTPENDGLGVSLRIYAAAAQVAQDLPLERRLRPAGAVPTPDAEPVPDGQGSLLTA